MALLSKEQKAEAWRLFNETHDNSDQVIAKKIGTTHNRVTVYLAYRCKKIIERINRRIESNK